MELTSVMIVNLFSHGCDLGYRMHAEVAEYDDECSYSDLKRMVEV